MSSQDTGKFKCCICGGKTWDVWLNIWMFSSCWWLKNTNICDETAGYFPVTFVGTKLDFDKFLCLWLKNLICWTRLQNIFQLCLRWQNQMCWPRTGSPPQTNTMIFNGVVTTGNRNVNLQKAERLYEQQKLHCQRLFITVVMVLGLGSAGFHPLY